MILTVYRLYIMETEILAPALAPSKFVATEAKQVYEKEKKIYHFFNNFAPL